MLWETACPQFDDGQLSFEYCEFVVVMAYPLDSLAPPLIKSWLRAWFSVVIVQFCCDDLRFCGLRRFNAVVHRRRSLWDRGTCPPNIYEGRTSIVMPPPQYFRSDVVQDVDSSDSNCCLLYFNANSMCSFTKSFSFWGTPRPPAGALPLDPTGGP